MHSVRYAIYESWTQWKLCTVHTGGDATNRTVLPTSAKLCLFHSENRRRNVNVTKKLSHSGDRTIRHLPHTPSARQFPPTFKACSQHINWTELLPSLVSARAAFTDLVNCGVSGGRWTLTRWSLSSTPSVTLEWITVTLSWPDKLQRVLTLRAAQTVLGVYLKRTRSRVTSASSALAVLNDHALYKSTHSHTHSLPDSSLHTAMWTTALDYMRWELTEH